MNSALTLSLPALESFEDVASRADDLLAAGHVDQAIELWERVLAAQPRNAEAAHSLAKTLIGSQRFEDALGWLKTALAVRPGMLAAKSDLGLALLKLNRFDEAAAALQSVLSLDPDNAIGIARLGTALHGAKKHEEAAKALRKAHLLLPGDPAIALELGNVLRTLQQTDAAIEAYRQALQIDAALQDAAASLGALLIDKRAFDEAATLIGKVVEANPNDQGGWLNLGAAFLGARRYAESLASYRRALALQPASVIAYCNMALALFSLGRLEEAILASKTALTLEPGSAVANFNMGCIYLALGHMREGWEGYEYRFAIGNKRWAHENAIAAPWMGEPLAGKSILVIGEQGNGDHIHFCRYVTVLAALGAEVSYLAPSRLHGLLSTLAGSIKFLSDLPAGTRFDFQVALMSIPRWVDLLNMPFPGATPYLSAEMARVARWRDTIGDREFRIGVIWQGNIYPSGDFRRSYRLDALRPVSLIPGVRLISLQMGEATGQIDQLPKDMRVEVLGADFDTGDQAFLDSAAVMEGVDLVISCDTALAHLAGALGRPVWIALPSDPEWRWQRYRDETEWYPTARLFRQQALDDWDGVFTTMARELKPLVASKGGILQSTPRLTSLQPSVETSWGEVFDRVGILRIMAERLDDTEALAQVRRELEHLGRTISVRGTLSHSLVEQRDRLNDLNEKIWTARDQLQAGENAQRFDTDFVECARSLQRLQGERAALKRSIDRICFE